MRRFPWGFCLGVGAALLLSAAPVLAQSSGTPDLVQIFEQASGTWRGAAFKIARNLFGAFFVLELVVSGIQWAGAREGVDQILRELVLKVVVASAVLWALLFPQNLLQPLSDAFQRAGASVVGSQVRTAGEIMVEGGNFWSLYLEVLDAPWKNANRLTIEDLKNPSADGEPGFAEKAFAAAGLGDVVDLLRFLKNVSLLFATNIFTLLAVFMGMVAIVIAFTTLAAQLVLAEIRVIFILSAGLVIAGFGSFRLTAGMAEGYVKYAMQGMVRLYFIQVMAGLLTALIPIWREVMKTAIVQGPDVLTINATVPLTVAMSVTIYAYLAWVIPAELASRLSLGVDGMIRTGLAGRA